MAIWTPSFYYLTRLEGSAKNFITHFCSIRKICGTRPSQNLITMPPYVKSAPVEKQAPTELPKVEEFAQDEQVDKVADSESEEEQAEKRRQKIVRVDQM
jgi:hypothetical protein